MVPGADHHRSDGRGPAVGTAHLDDALALLFGCRRSGAALADRAILAGAPVGLAVDSKPWTGPVPVPLPPP